MSEMIERVARAIDTYAIAPGVGSDGLPCWFTYDVHKWVEFAERERPIRFSAIHIEEFQGAEIARVRCDELNARAAIAAMRDPSTKMCAAAANALKKHIDGFSEQDRENRWPGRKDDEGWRVPNKEKHCVRYQAMIDAALGEK